MAAAIKEFEVDLTVLSAREKQLLEKLIAASKLIAPLYLKQKNSQYPGANFYPADATREEIREAAEKNSNILDPYTFVERDSSGELTAIPFHIKFQKELEPAAKLLREAADLSDEEVFAQYLKVRADSLLDGDYKKSDIIWLSNKAFYPKIGFIIGPIERYLDKLFFVKCAYQAWVGIMDQERTQKAVKFKNTIVASRHKILPGSEKVALPVLRTRIDKAVLFSGLIADFMFTGTNLPNEVNLMKEYGSNLVIFSTSLDEKFEKDQLPVFRSVFAAKIQRSYSQEQLYEGSLACIFSHEIAHSLIRYEDAEERLGEFFPVFDEISGYIIGIRSYAFLFLKGLVTQKELESILVMHLCRHFVWWLDSKNNPDVMPYARGAAIALNFFLREGGIKHRMGIYWPDFSKLLLCVDELSRILEYHLALGTRDEAREFVKEYGSFEVFESFAPRLKKIIKN